MTIIVQALNIIHNRYRIVVLLMGHAPVLFCGQGFNGWTRVQWMVIQPLLQVPKGHQMVPGPISMQTQGDPQTVAVQLNLEHVNFHDVSRKACNIHWIASFVLRSSCRLLICIHCMWLTIRMFSLISDKNAKQVLQLQVSHLNFRHHEFEAQISPVKV